MATKRFYGILFLISLFTGVVQPAMPLIEYYVFQESIIELLCENKERPDMECDGMCYLKKQIEEQQDGQASQPLSLINADDIIPLFLSMQTLNTSRLSPFFSSLFSAPIQYLFKSSADIFHPPRG